MEITSKKLLKIYKHYKGGYALVDYRCEYCGTVHENIVFRFKKINFIWGCDNCIITNLSEKQNRIILGLFIQNKSYNNNYISSRLKDKNEVSARKLAERFLAKDNNYKLLNDNTTIGLKNPFVELVDFDDLIIKNIKENQIDRIRYLHRVEKYENKSIARHDFKIHCKKLNYNFDDFEEVDSGEYYTRIRGNTIINTKKYNYFFKRGTIEDYYYKK